MSSGDEEDATSAAMAAMMGFSSFGAQDRPSKKRRFNPRADAATGTGRQGPLPPPPAGTGANSAPLGPARHYSSNLPLHPTPRDDDDDDDDDERQPQYIDTSRPVGHEEPADPEEEARFQAQIDAIVAAGNATYGSVAPPPSSSSASLSAPAPAPGLDGGPLPAAATAPARVPGGPGRGGAGGRGGHRHGAGPGGDWWIGYYDPSSNENPWARLEGQLGLQAHGSWLARGERVG
ncbi:uncharacterized protein E0L32_003262 [Thyridium curvatum]|uniref:Uncharacterized protein n=1 Tax=Thyridium curvatum TaxID=1093900 RepID=A0A507BEF4_9PEZI|nr:uncharacterized protein E0L32_003262 [Thyridium curvatum]TPX17144.1 hypothetical protein E0L32_003262 [Thyridium curvatum]